MEGKRRQKGERLIITKSRWNRRVKERLQCQIEDKRFSKSDRNAGEIDKGKGGAMTQKEKLKIGVVG